MPFGSRDHLHQPGDHADPVQVSGGRVLLIGVSLGDEEDDVPVVGRRVDRGERLRAPDDERHDDVRKQHDIAERQNGQAFRHLEALGVAGQDQRHDRKSTTRKDGMDPN